MESADRGFVFDVWVEYVLALLFHPLFVDIGWRHLDESVIFDVRCLFDNCWYPDLQQRGKSHLLFFKETAERFKS